jgi:hypothetical protein
MAEGHKFKIMNAKIEAPILVDEPTRSGQSLFARIKALWQADFLSPKDFVRRALVIAAAYYIVSAFGLREFTSILNGTMASVSLGWHTSAFLGLLYIIFYLAFVLIAPTMLIAAGILLLWKKIVK